MANPKYIFGGKERRGGAALKYYVSSEVVAMRQRLRRVRPTAPFERPEIKKWSKLQ